MSEPRDVPPTLEVVAAVISDRGLVLAARRSPGRDAAGWWEFPGGKIEPGEEPRAALRRELHEELGIDVLVGDLLGSDDTDVGGVVIRLHCYAVVLRGPRPSVSTDHDELRWCRPDQLAELAWARPDRPMVARLGSWNSLR